MAKKTNKVRVAIIGVGNCASSFVQGVEYYKDAPEDQEDGQQLPEIVRPLKAHERLLKTSRDSPESRPVPQLA